MVFVVLLLCISALCWALLLLNWTGRRTRTPKETRVTRRDSPEVLDLQRERWRRRKSGPHRQEKKLH